jgi:hypothetical protein
LISRTQSFIN